MPKQITEFQIDHPSWPYGLYEGLSYHLVELGYKVEDDPSFLGEDSYGLLISKDQEILDKTLEDIEKAIWGASEFGDYTEIQGLAHIVLDPQNYSPEDYKNALNKIGLEVKMISSKDTQGMIINVTISPTE